LISESSDMSARLKRFPMTMSVLSWRRKYINVQIM
jgi:hypothetical protein